MSAHGWGLFAGADPHYSEDADGRDAYADTEPCPMLVAACELCGGPNEEAGPFCSHQCREEALLEEARERKAEEQAEMDREEER